jgi:hypothetical protein
MNIDISFELPITKIFSVPPLLKVLFQKTPLCIISASSDPLWNIFIM